MSLLVADELRAGYGNVRILHGLSIEVAPGSVTALVGGNGAGKTTTMRALAGLLPLAGGSIRLEGAEIGTLPGSRRVEQGIALVPEGRMVFPTLSVEENLRLGAISRRAREGARERMAEMYALFPRLQERRGQAAGSLSGGEQQQLAIARGLMARPCVLLLDEPTLGLAPIMAKFIFDTLRDLRAAGLTLLVAEQDVRSTLALADRAYVVENGRIAFSGSGGELLDDPRVRSAFLGI